MLHSSIVVSIFMYHFSIDGVVLDCGNSVNSCPDTSITLTCHVPFGHGVLTWILPANDDNHINFISGTHHIGSVVKKTLFGTELAGVLVNSDGHGSMVSTLTFNSSAIPSGSEIKCRSGLIITDGIKSCVVSVQGIAE